MVPLLFLILRAHEKTQLIRTLSSDYASEGLTLLDPLFAADATWVMPATSKKCDQATWQCLHKRALALVHYS